MRKGDKAAISGAHRGKLTSLHPTPTYRQCFLPCRGTRGTSGWRIGGVSTVPGKTTDQTWLWWQLSSWWQHPRQWDSASSCLSASCEVECPQAFSTLYLQIPFSFPTVLCGLHKSFPRSDGFYYTQHSGYYQDFGVEEPRFESWLHLPNQVTAWPITLWDILL